MLAFKNRIKYVSERKENKTRDWSQHLNYRSRTESLSTSVTSV